MAQAADGLPELTRLAGGLGEVGDLLSDGLGPLVGDPVGVPELVQEAVFLHGCLETFLLQAGGLPLEPELVFVLGAGLAVGQDALPVQPELFPIGLGQGGGEFLPGLGQGLFFLLPPVDFLFQAGVLPVIAGEQGLLAVPVGLGGGPLAGQLVQQRAEGPDLRLEDGQLLPQGRNLPIFGQGFPILTGFHLQEGLTGLGPCLLQGGLAPAKVLPGPGQFLFQGIFLGPSGEDAPLSGHGAAGHGAPGPEDLSVQGDHREAVVSPLGQGHGMV